MELYHEFARFTYLKKFILSIVTNVPKFFQKTPKQIGGR